MNDRIFVANKPAGISSSQFLGKIKRKYKVKKAGFSGTLDPFAKGCLIIAFGKYTKLFRFLSKSPKKYKATLWLGAFSDTLDTEKIEKIEILKPFLNLSFLEKELKGEIKYFPPKYCAKKINGKRAYNLARQDIDFSLKEEKMHIYDFKILNYCHPFLSFEAKVSEGSYIRSMGEIIAQKLGTFGCLSYLERLSEGEFFYNNEIALDPYNFLNLEENFYLGDLKCMQLGQKLFFGDFKFNQDGYYKVLMQNEFSIIEINNNEVIYHINRIPLC